MRRSSDLKVNRPNCVMSFVKSCFTILFTNDKNKYTVANDPFT